MYSAPKIKTKKMIFFRVEDSDKLNEAAKWYYQALQMDPNNVYAANGIAVCLAELHLLTEAKLILEQLREVISLTY